MPDLFHAASVLIVSDDSEFARAVAARWQAEPRSPGITIASGEIWHPSVSFGYHLVIVGPVREGRSASILGALCNAPVPAVVHIVESEQDVPFLQSQYPQLPIIARQDSWLNTLILVSSEALRRVEALARAQRAERLAQGTLQDASLGRYMLEMRPGINNALTSVLGNADLLMLGAGSLTPETREQVRAMHTMALRLHEVMQRFSSLAAEMRASENDSHDETGEASHREAVRL